MLRVGFGDRCHSGHFHELQNIIRPDRFDSWRGFRWVNWRRTFLRDHRMNH